MQSRGEGESLRVEREREFHDRRFAQNEGARSQGVFYAGLARTGRRIADQEMVQLAQGRDVLELGCATGRYTIMLSQSARHVHGIDISPIAVAQAKTKAREGGVTNVSFGVEDAEKMSFESDSFDLVIGNGVLHHLDLRGCLPELARVLRPGGIGLFVEPLGHNPLINLYRRLTPSARTPDEHPLRRRDFELAGQYFSDVEVRFFEFMSLAALAVRNTRLFDPLHRTLTGMDQLAFKIPGVRWLAWMSIMYLRR